MDSTRSFSRWLAILSLALQALILQALAACSYELDGPAPTVQALDPSIVCSEQLTTEVKINGDGMSPMAEEALTSDPKLALPAITLTRTADLYGGAATSTVKINPAPGTDEKSRVHWTSQKLYSFEVYPELSLPTGIYSITVDNANKKTATAPKALAVVPPPKVDKIEVNPVCLAQGAQKLTITGTGFLILGTVQPTVTIDGNPVTVTNVSGCTALVDTRTPAQICTTIEITLPKDSLSIGSHAVVVTNPAPAACKSTPATELIVEPPPTITKVEPVVICAGGGDLVITGTNFAPKGRVKVTVGDTPATVNASTPTQLNVTIGAIPPGTYDVTVDNGSGCTATLPDALRVTPGPSVYFIDPPTVYNGISIQATIYVTGLLGAPTAVQIRSAAGQASPLGNVTYDTAHPNRILATVPSGLAAGDYDVQVSDGQCIATLPQGLHVVSQLTVGIDSVTPPFGWRLEDTAVTIAAKDPAPGGQVQFQATPRAYLNPKSGGSALARPVEAVVFVNATRLTAVVGRGLAAGAYDLIVVNPDRSVGLLASAFQVTADAAPPPIIDTLTPAAVVDQPGQQVNVLGSNFRSPSVRATCVDDTTGAMSTIDATGVSGSATSVSATFNMGALSSGVCAVRLTNSDGTYVDWSALAVSNPAQNLVPTVTDGDMATARRGLSAASGRVTSQARYLYAIGGDDGTDAGLLTSIETAPVSLFGDLDPFFTLPGALPAGRSLAKTAVIGRFVYLVGGRVAAGATGSVLRAQLLDPRNTPNVIDLDIVPGVDTGLGPGTYYYRVSAVMPPDDTSNPGGETLASDPFGVILPTPPANLPGKYQLTLILSAVQGAASYRIYRTPAAGQAVGTVKLIGTASPRSLTFTDTGLTAQADTPLPEGSLGKWREVGPMPTAREGAGVAFAADPDSAGAYFLYAIGGRNAAGAALASYTFARIAVASDSSQTVSAFANDVAVPGMTARWQLGAVAMDHAHGSQVPAGDTWIYAMGGYSATRSPIPDVTAGKVSGDGTLVQLTEVQKMSPAIAGYGYAVANGFLFSFGGAAGNGIAGVAAKSAQVTTVPELANWNDEGTLKLKQARYLPGTALESAFIFMVGGASDTAAATKTTERTHW